MNAWTTALIWGCVQITLFSAVASVVYLAIRRRGPIAGSHFILWTLAVVIGMTALAVSPWPTWRRVADRGEANSLAGVPENRPAMRSATGIGVNSNAGLVGEINLDSEAPSATAPVGAVSPLDAAWQGFVNGLSRAPAADAGWDWPRILAWLLLTSSVLATSRLLCGLIAVSGYRRAARPIRDRALLDLAARLEQDLGQTLRAELSESDLISSPATIGWRRPLVLLPVSWREWTDQERRVVLSHELAHVARRDYLASICAQLGVALHFYNPVVRWLASRLRIEQEIAADAAGAAISGGTQNYLATLAAMALAQDDRRLNWAARPFLPARGTLLRRVETLRDARSASQQPLTSFARRALVTVLFGLGVAVVGFRGPAMEQAAAADPPAPASAPASADPATDAGYKFDLTYVPEEAVVVLAVRPASLAQDQGFSEILKDIGEQLEQGKKYGQRLDVADIEEVVLALTDFTKGPAEASMITTFKTGKPVNWKQTVFCDPEKAVEFKPNAANQAHGAIGKPLFYVADDRTLVVASGGVIPEPGPGGAPPTWEVSPQVLAKLVAHAKDHPAPDWAKNWRHVEQDQVAVMVTFGLIQAMDRQLAGGAAAGPPVALIRSLWTEGTRYASFGARIEHSRDKADLKATIAFDYDNAKAAEQGEQSIRALLGMAAMALGNAAPSLEKPSPGSPSEAQMAVMKQLSQVALGLFSSAKFTRQEGSVMVEAQAPFTDLPRLIAGFLPATKEARSAAQKTQGMNLVKQISLAMLNYESAKKSFPTAYTTKDGKPLLSWRVAILPFLEQQSLYNEFHQDEPWDSEHNKKLIERMPVLYRSPVSKVADQGRTAYVVPRGKETMFPDDGKALRIQQIRDGSSNTLLVVETDDAHAVIWTKPDDWEFDPAHPAAGLGGQYPGSITIGFCDGHVITVPASTPSESWKAWVTPAGGEKPPAP